MQLSIPGVDGVLTGTLSDGATSKNLYFAISALTNLNLACEQDTSCFPCHSVNQACMHACVTLIMFHGGSCNVCSGAVVCSHN